MSRKVRFICVLCCLSAGFASAQSNIPATIRLITRADSVILISHLTTAENHDKPEAIIASTGMPSDTNAPFYPHFMCGTGINPLIIVQRHRLRSQEIDRLISILRAPGNRYGIGSDPLCFEPHHAILIYTNSKCSFIEICFHCKGLINSADLNLTNSDFPKEKWGKLKAFFLQMGLNYELSQD